MTGSHYKSDAIKDAIKEYLGNKKEGGERATILNSVIAIKTGTGKRTVWRSMEDMRENREIVRKSEEDGTWYYLPRYATKRVAEKIIATQEHSKNIKESVIEPLLNEFKKIRICWHGAYLSFKNDYYSENTLDEIKEEYDMTLLINLTGEEDLVSEFLFSTKKNYGEALVTKLWEDFIKNHTTKNFGNPLELIRRFKDLCRDAYGKKREIFSDANKLTEKIGLTKYIDNKIRANTVVGEIFRKRSIRNHYYERPDK